MTANRDYWANLGYEIVVGKDGRVWRLKRGQSQDGTPHTGRCSWYAATGSAGRSDQWKFGATRNAVFARIAQE